MTDDKVIEFKSQNDGYVSEALSLWAMSLKAFLLRMAFVLNQTTKLSIRRRLPDSGSYTRFDYISLVDGRRFSAKHSLT